MNRIDVDPRPASDALRSELIFLPDDGSLTPFDGGFVLLTPSNPTYWWGNSLRLARAPEEGDFDRWMKAFEALVHDVQPESAHRTFGWDGDLTGDIDPFVSAGFDYFEIIGLTVGRDSTVRAPHFNASSPVVRLEGQDWDSLLALLVETRDTKHTVTGYAAFAAQQIDGWRTLESRGQGCWFGIRNGEQVVAALGIFAERSRGIDERRIGRFQQVVTHPSMRRRGYCGTLVEQASTFAFDHLDVDTLLIAADENAIARRIYESCGYRITSRHRCLERGY